MKRTIQVDKAKCYSFIARNNLQARKLIREGRKNNMANCPNCGTKVISPIKCWTVSPAKRSANGVVPEFRVGLFMCPECKSKFRSKVPPAAKTAETANIRDLAERVKEIREGLTRSLKTLRERIGLLETERSSLLVEIDSLKKAAESRANALENEVNALREEIQSLKELLGSAEEAF
jgi:predicted  nucleic acid-binding Zn-ribbon protein